MFVGAQFIPATKRGVLNPPDHKMRLVIGRKFHLPSDKTLLAICN